MTTSAQQRHKSIAVDVGGVTVGGAADLLAGGRVDHGEGLARTRGHEAAADEVMTGQGAGEGGLVQRGFRRRAMGAVEHRVCLPERLIIGLGPLMAPRAGASKGKRT